MGFYSILRYILCQFPPGKLVPLGQMVEGESKNADFFTSVQCNLIYLLMINAYISNEKTLLQ